MWKKFIAEPVPLTNHISLSTVYRTVRLFEEEGIIERHEFRDGRARYERVDKQHHDHLIDMKTGNVIEFRNEKIEELQKQIAAELGFELNRPSPGALWHPIEKEIARLNWGTSAS